MSHLEPIDTLHDYPDDPDIQCANCDSWFPESEKTVGDSGDDFCPTCSTPPEERLEAVAA